MRVEGCFYNLLILSICSMSGALIIINTQFLFILVTNHIFLNQFCVVPIKTSFFTDPCMFLRCEQNCTFFIIYLEEVRAGICRPCVETKLTATKKSATDGN